MDNDDFDLPKGVEIHGASLRIVFMLEGVRMRELLKVAKINKNSIKYAANKRSVILTEIKESNFDYLKHFPESPRALKYSGASCSDINRTIAQGIDNWLEISAEKNATATIEGYRSKAKRVKEYFENRRIRSIKQIDITRFRKHLIEVDKLEIKTINDTFTPLRQAFILAKQEGIIKDNLLELIPNLESDDDEESQADPYTEKNLKAIWKLKNEGFYKPQVVNMFLFTCWTGLSLSEVIALAWEDIDMTEMTIKVQRARVGKEYKATKASSRTREFELLQPAIDILLDQKKHTFMQSPSDLNVRRRNNVNFTDQSVRFIFKNTMPECEDGHWKSKAVQGAYADLLRKAKIRHRGPNQCRHTFASMMITKLVPLDIIASLMGHTSTKMIKKHYAKIIPEDKPHVAKLVSAMMGIEYNFKCQEVRTK